MPSASSGPWRPSTSTGLALDRLAEEGNIRLRNRPFHQLSQRYPQLVCGMNLDIMQAMVEELGLARLEARLESQPGM
jgi:predicted ArsR family transcriptional regulator